MAILVLWSSAGAAIYQHICLSSNTYTTSLYTEEDCGMEHTKVIEKKDCCNESPIKNKQQETSISEQCCITDSHFLKTISLGLSGNILINTWQDFVKVWHYLPALFTFFKSLLHSAVSTQFFGLLPCCSFQGKQDTVALLQVFRC
jgi:hypothetical protein